MDAHDPIQELMNDHRLIEKVLSSLEKRLADPDEPFPAEFVEQALDFLVSFADGCHHYKEEETLFPAIANLGVPVEGGPIEMMLHEHKEGRRCIKGIRDNLPAAREGNTRSQDAVRRFAAEYTGLLRHHIWKEDNVLFLMAKQVLTADAAEEVARRFSDESNPHLASAVKQRYAEFANSL
jgi:hemerythrin-like domain-containing protein